MDHWDSRQAEPYRGCRRVAASKSVFSGARQIAICKRLLHTGAKICSADDDGDVAG